jgi:hypothetical protein
MGNRTPRHPLPPALRFNESERSGDDDEIDEDPEDDDDPDDDDDYDDGVDPLEMLQCLRLRQEPTDGRAWVEVSATMESITYALEFETPGSSSCEIGCLVRVVSWDFEGLITSSPPVFVPGATVSSLKREP